jgi:NADH-quinone oxidoreductase subunit N
MLILDSFAIFFKLIFLIAAALSIAISLKYLDIERENHGEYYALILFATMGMMFMAGAVDLVTLYIGLETMAIATYVLVGFLRSNQRSNEASMKYFLLGAFSSGILLYGMSLLYGISGSTKFADIAQALSQRPSSDPISLIAMTRSRPECSSRSRLSRFTSGRRMRTKERPLRSRRSCLLQ